MYVTRPKAGAKTGIALMPPIMTKWSGRPTRPVNRSVALPEATGRGNVKRLRRCGHCRVQRESDQPISMTDLVKQLADSAAVIVVRKKDKIGLRMRLMRMMSSAMAVHNTMRQTERLAHEQS